MSHFPVTVILPEGATRGRAESLVERALAPFDENSSVEPYPIPLVEDPALLAMILDEKAEGWSGEAIEALRENATYLDALLRQGTIRTPTSACEALSYLPETARRRADLVIAYAPPQLVAEALSETGEDDAWRLDDSGNVIRLSTYNPKSKWDWWEIGGRWDDYWTTGATPDVILPASEVLARRPALAAAILESEAARADEITDEMRAEIERGAGTTLALLDAASGEWREAGRVGWFGTMDPAMERAEWQARWIELLEGAGDRLCVIVDCHI